MVSKVRDFLMDEGFIEYVLGVSSKLFLNGKLISRYIRNIWLL